MSRLSTDNGQRTEHEDSARILEAEFAISVTVVTCVSKKEGRCEYLFFPSQLNLATLCESSLRNLSERFKDQNLSFMSGGFFWKSLFLSVHYYSVLY